MIVSLKPGLNIFNFDAIHLDNSRGTHFLKFAFFIIN